MTTNTYDGENAKEEDFWPCQMRRKSAGQFVTQDVLLHFYKEDFKYQNANIKYKLCSSQKISNIKTLIH